MRSFRLLLLVLVVLGLAWPLAGCDSCGMASDYQLVLRSPVLPQTTPIPKAQGYAIAVPEGRRYEALREYSAPAPAYRYEPLPRARSVNGCSDGGAAPYSPPPVPGDDVPESIPALRQ